MKRFSTVNVILNQNFFCLFYFYIELCPPHSLLLTPAVSKVTIITFRYPFELTLMFISIPKTMTHFYFFSVFESK